VKRFSLLFLLALLLATCASAEAAAPTSGIGTAVSKTIVRSTQSVIRNTSHGVRFNRRAAGLWSLKVGSRGRRVRAAQYVLRGHNAFHVHSFNRRVDGVYRLAMVRATQRAKWLLGYPHRSVDGRYGPTLRLFLLGKRPLPAKNVALRADRLAMLEVGDRGQRVKDLQWLLAGNPPSVYKIKSYRGRIDGVFGRSTWRAVKGMKWRLGYPSGWLDGRAGPQLVRILTGKEARPLKWIGRASARAKQRAQGVGSTLCARAAVRLANSQVGVSEVPYGSNRGSQVAKYQSVTGAYGLAWCASFAQWVLKRSGFGTIAGRSAAVYPIVAWAHRQAWVHARAKVGAVVAFLTWQGHMGVVTAVSRRGFTTVEGNSSNGVRRRWYPHGYRSAVFIWVPCRHRFSRPAPVSRHADVGGHGLPVWLIVLVLVGSALTGVEGARRVAKRLARRAAHEIGELADDVEQKLEEK